MTTIVQVEFRESLLSIRDQILRSLGHPVISALASRAARDLDLSHEKVGVVLIGHGAPWEERCNFATHLSVVPIVASLRRQDKDVTGADYNLPPDNPPLCVNTVRQALWKSGSRISAKHSLPCDSDLRFLSANRGKVATLNNLNCGGARIDRALAILKLKKGT
jgi:hypothetical protein